MQRRRVALPAGFFALGSAWPAPLFALEFSLELLAVSTLFFGGSGAIAGTATWLAVAGDDPSPRRGAVVATLASLVAAVVVVPGVTFVAWVVDWLVLGGGVDAGPNVLVSAMILGLVALALSPLSAALGYAVGRDPSLSPPRPPRVGGFDVDGLRRAPSTWTLVVASVVLAAVVVGAGVVQYTDPTTPDAGDGPAYAGPDAPAAAQVEQAQSRTRAVSHTVVVTTESYGENASSRPNPVLVVRHDLDADVAQGVVRLRDGTASSLLTVDGHWRWAGNDSNPRPESMRRIADPPMAHPYSVDATLAAPARVVNRSDGVVTIRYERAGGTRDDPIDVPGNRTVRIDAETGRLLSFTDQRVREDGVRAVVTVRYRAYERTTVDAPRTPAGSVGDVLRDLLYGPLNGDGTLHD